MSTKMEAANSSSKTKKLDNKSVQNKRKKHKNKKTVNKDTVVRLPQKSQDFSSNWKTLLQKMESERKTLPRKKLVKKAVVDERPTKVVEKKPEVWFDDVDPALLEDSRQEERKSNQKAGLVKDNSFRGLTKVLGIDCEMVGVGFKGTDSILARISIVNHFGHCVYDKYVKPTEKVTDYRTYVSGIRPEDIEKGEEFKVVQKEVNDLLTGRVLVGHSIKNDLKVLFLNHPRKMIRDTATYKPFRTAFGGRTPSLKNLTAKMLGVNVQQGEHSSVQDAQAAVRLYTMCRRDWETELNKKRLGGGANMKKEVNKMEVPKVPPPPPPKAKGQKLIYSDSDSD